MTTPTTDPDRLPWWRYLGPWPLQPLAMGVLAALATMVSNAPLFTFDNIGTLLLSSLACGAATTGALWLAVRLIPRLVSTLTGFLTVILLVSVVNTVIRQFSGTFIDYAGLSLWVDVAFMITRYFIVSWIVLVILGLIQRRLQVQVDRAEEALSVVRQQAGALLAADEITRQQVAELLHDRVQAGLIGACLQLQQVLDKLEESDRDHVMRIIDSLEQIRGLDVRRAVRSLSPNLTEVDFESALQELADAYEPAMSVAFGVDIGEQIPLETRLGAYRIVEQALLNSAVHGRAESCVVDVRGNQTSVTIDVIDNGTGLPDEVSPGLGSTLTSTWCRTLGGDWSRTQTPHGGVHLHAELSCAVNDPLINPQTTSRIGRLSL